MERVVDVQHLGQAESHTFQFGASIYAEANPLPSAFFGEACTNVVHQHVAHRGGSESHEMRAALPVVPREPEPCLVDQGGGLQARLRGVPLEVKGGNLAQL